MLGGVGSGVDGIAEGRREDDARQGVEPGDRTARQGCRLAARETWFLRHLVRKIDDEWPFRFHAA
jgi:hypothetical protein